jgi:hypothetical protein
MLSKSKKKANQIDDSELEMDQEALKEKFKNTLLYEIYTNSFSVIYKKLIKR